MNREKHQILPFPGMLLIGLVLIALMTVLMVVQYSVPYDRTHKRDSLLSKEDAIHQREVLQKDWEGRMTSAKCILLTENEDTMSLEAVSETEPVLTQMQIPYQKIDAGSMTTELMQKADTIIIAVTHYQKLSAILGDLNHWVEDGGKLMILYPPENSGSFLSLANLFGIKDCGDNTLVETIRPVGSMMLGGNRDYPVTEPFESSMDLTITEDCLVYLESADDYPLPLLWRRSVGKGSLVFDNIGFFEKAYRGIHAAAISLLGQATAYPVINGAIFYIDDFPSPIPEGDSTKIREDYNMTIEDFYSQVWWNDVYDLAEKYGLKYTGLIVEDYSDQVDGVFEREKDTSRYRYFGSMLLKQGGELGIHGYNHMPLVLSNFDYKDQFDSYRTWSSAQAIKDSLKEVRNFAKQLFPTQSFSVYVPPSNILSDEGEAILAQTPVNCIAAIYLPGNLAREQEFCVDEYGLVDTPRVISGYIMDDYTQLVAFSELNFHMVSSHFQHPDDVLDEERGADLGWEKMFGNLKSYVSWLYDSVPSIRTLTGSQMAEAVEKYAFTSLESEMTETGMELILDHFDQEAWVMLRLNEGQIIGSMEGASYEKEAEGLYLLHCTQEKVEITFE